MRVNPVDRLATVCGRCRKEVDDRCLVFRDHQRPSLAVGPVSAADRRSTVVRSHVIDRATNVPSHATHWSNRSARLARAASGPRSRMKTNSVGSIPRPLGRLRSRTAVFRAAVMHQGLILLCRVVVRSVLGLAQGHESRSHSDLTDRDRDASSRRAISAWVRTNPQTHVRYGAPRRAPILAGTGGRDARARRDDQQREDDRADCGC